MGQGFDLPFFVDILFQRCEYYSTIITQRRMGEMAKKKGIPGLSFSWKRAIGVTKVKRKIAKATGIPTTKSGRQAKVGKLLGIK